ncbi:hypothetical protein AHAS_Ahas11G0286600 [Arachis hypogaea]
MHLSPGFGGEGRNRMVKICFGEAVEGGGGSDGLEHLVLACAVAKSVEQRGVFLLLWLCGGGECGEIVVWFESECGGGWGRRKSGCEVDFEGFLGGFNATAINMDSLIALQASGTLYCKE